MNQIDLSNIIHNYVVSIGLVLGGVWAFWKWGFSEWLRQSKAMPSIDGELSVLTELFKEDMVILTLSAMWRNRGDLPVYINAKSTCVNVYELKNTLNCGPIHVDEDLGEPVYTIYPYDNFEKYVFEPNTESTVNSHFKLKRNIAYLLQWKLYQGEKKYEKYIKVWKKELIYEANTYNNAN